MSTITLTWEEENDDENVDEDFIEHAVEFPARNEVCPDCEGNGRVLNPSMRGHAYTMEEFNQEFDDDQQQEYFKPNGIYSIICPTCKGSNVISVPDESAMTTEQKTLFTRYEKCTMEKEESRNRFDAELRAEIRFGC